MSSIPAPLAERLRPESLDQLVGQKHLTGKGSILRAALEQGKMPSMILWGPRVPVRLPLPISLPIPSIPLFIP